MRNGPGELSLRGRFAMPSRDLVSVAVVVVAVIVLVVLPHLLLALPDLLVLLLLLLLPFLVVVIVPTIIASSTPVVVHDAAVENREAAVGVAARVLDDHVAVTVASLALVDPAVPFATYLIPATIDTTVAVVAVGGIGAAAAEDDVTDAVG